MLKTEFHISGMDCPSEEGLIRMKLEGLAAVEQLVFDLEARRLTVYHNRREPEIESRLLSLNLGARQVSEETVAAVEVPESDAVQRRLLWMVLAINFGFFVLEMAAGWLAGSMGLVADSLDMLADSVVYALSLWAVGAVVGRKKKVATLSGYFQLLLALLGLAEVLRRFFGAAEAPDFRIMIGISVLALLANAVALYLLQKSKSSDAHMKASLIFTSNDIIINAGVILAGVLVLLTGSSYPDLVVGAFVFAVVVRGALRILKLGK